MVVKLFELTYHHWSQNHGHPMVHEVYAMGNILALRNFNDKNK